MMRSEKDRLDKLARLARTQGKPQREPGFVWNSTTQEFIPYLPEDHPDYRQNQEIIRAAIKRWNGGTSR
jgi:hypothetical protein